MKYSKIEGLKRTLKNLLIMFVAPAVLYTLTQVSAFVPTEILPVAIPIASGLSYFIKNYLENR